MAKYSYRKSGYIQGRNMPASSSHILKAYLNNLLNSLVYIIIKAGLSNGKVAKYFESTLGGGKWHQYEN
ncbi:hypothetical protein [Nostoc flagelliforme]|uniref:hypothetical protein n=1 Tax=Nostoc flagelliforme TaxID=1306274 RepID=UPI001689ECEC|nr:hypothetical protein [Nostoc flagelliforme]